MSYLVLKSQMDLLQRNLTEVKRVVDAAEENQHRLRAEVSDPIENAKRINTEIRKLIQDLSGVCEDEGYVDAVELVEHLGDRRVELLKAINKCQEALDQVARRNPSTLGDFRTTLAMEVADKHINTKIQRIGELQDDLAETVRLEKRGETERALKQAREVWRRYISEVLPQTREIFEEYVDFLAGLALRYTGLDRGMCVIADELIAGAGRLPGFQWRSLAVPVRAEHPSLTHMIGLSFPEWTIWSLPLSGHALGLAWMNSQQVAEWVEKEEADVLARATLHTCMADAVATYVLGPAYPCALIILRLDPFAAFAAVDGGLTAKRAWIALRTLERLSTHNGSGFADELLDRLRQEWNAALRQAGHEELVAPSPGTALTPEEGGLTAAAAEPLDRWIGVVVEKIGETPSFRGSRWPDAVVPLADALANDKPIPEEILTNERADVLRDVLNAVWECRLAHSSADLTKIDEAAKALWESLGLPEESPRDADRGRRSDRSGATQRHQDGASARRAGSRVD